MTRELRHLAEDRERRERAVELKEWVEAPPPPLTRGECEEGPRPCPHLRCIHHVGKRGDGSFSCVLDFAELPDNERTLADIGRVLGLSRQRVEQLVALGEEALKKKIPHDTLIALRLRKRS